MTRGDYSSAQHARIMQLEAKIQSLVDAWEKTSDTTNAALMNDGALLFTLLEMKNTLKHKDYDGDYAKFLQHFNETGFTK